MIRPDLTIERSYLEQGTYGRMMVGGMLLYTVERPWLGNRVGVSCIPEGLYKCRPRRYYKGDYDAIEITDVPGRTFILFHVANRPSEVRGCIAPNLSLGGFLKNEWSGRQSRRAFQILMEDFGGREFTLKIQQHRPVDMNPQNPAPRS